MAIDIVKSPLHGIHKIEDIELVVRALERPTPAVKALADVATRCWAVYDAKLGEARVLKLDALDAEEALLRAVKEQR